MKRTGLRSYTRLTRSKPMRPTLNSMRSRWSRKSKTSPEDQDRLDWLHGRPCAAPGHEHCRLPVDVHHDTQNRALGTKSPHSCGIPICHVAHMGFHSNSGPFKGWKRAQLREWQTAQVERFQAAWDRRCHETGDDSFPA